jgi:hypothetical protein
MHVTPTDERYVARLLGGPHDGLAFTVAEAAPSIRLPAPSRASGSGHPGPRTSTRRVATYDFVGREAAHEASASLVILRYAYLESHPG